MNPSWRKNYSRYKSYFLNVTGTYRERTDVKVYLEILLSLGTIIIFSIFALRPTLLTITQLLKEIETKKATLAKMNKKLQDISSAQNIYDQNISSIRLLDTTVPQNPSVDALARQVEGLIKRHPVNLVNLSTGKATVLGDATGDEGNKNLSPMPENSSSLSFSFGISTGLADYPTVSELFSDLEKLRRPIKLDSLSISSVNAQQANEKIILFTIDGRVPYELKDK